MIDEDTNVVSLHRSAFLFIVTLVLAFGFGGGFRDRSFLRHRRAKVFPNEVNRNPRNHNNQSGPSRCRLINEEDGQNYRSAHNVQNRNQWVTESLVWPLSIRAAESQHNDSGNRQNIENQ